MVDTKSKSELELRVGLRNLRSKDLFSKSDPCIIVYQKRRKMGWTEVGRTEVIMNKHNPDFKKRFRMEYHFEQLQEVKFEVWDWDRNTKSTVGQDYIGCVTTTLANLVVDSGMPRPVMKRTGRVACKGRARMIIHSEELSESSEKCFFRLSGLKLPKMDFGLFSKSDPYLQVYRQSGGGEWTLVHQTEVIKKTLEPRWKPFTLSARDLCNGDDRRPILFRVWDYDSVGSHDLIGEFERSLSELRQGAQFGLKRPKKKKQKTYGQIEFSEYKKYREAMFLDYVHNGMEINLMYAIDFTGSNGDPSRPGSLHYRFGNQPSPYADAMQRISTILAPYDHDQLIPVYGFGARLKRTNAVSHCFPLNFNYDKPEVKGLPGIMSAYNRAFDNLLLSGPTYFSEVLQYAAAVASGHVFNNEAQAYTILVILTDGVIDDMRQTCDTLVQMSNLPISVIVVGIGKANFDKMETLDGDGKMLRDSRGNPAKRDIVQFVPMRNFHNNTFGLTDETLREIPTQVLQYAKERKVAPLVRAERDWSALMDEKAISGAVIGQPTYGQQAPPVMHMQQQQYQKTQPSGYTGLPPSQVQPGYIPGAQNVAYATAPPQNLGYAAAPPNAGYPNVGYPSPGPQQIRYAQNVQQVQPIPTTVQSVQPLRQGQNGQGYGQGAYTSQQAPPAYFQPPPPPS